MEIRAGDSLDELLVEIMLLFWKFIERLNILTEEIDEPLVDAAS